MLATMAEASTVEELRSTSGVVKMANLGGLPAWASELARSTKWPSVEERDQECGFFGQGKYQTRSDGSGNGTTALTAERSTTSCALSQSSYWTLCTRSMVGSNDSWEGERLEEGLIRVDLEQ